MLQIRGGVERDRFGKKAGKGALVTWGRAPTLGVSQDAMLIQIGGGMSEQDKTSVAASFGINPSASGMMLDSLPIEEVGMTLRKSPGGENGVITIANIISLMRYIVRRLTPTECSRLMGLPDGWTIPSNLVITDDLVEEFRQIHDNFNRIMAEYEGAKPPKPKTVAQVRKWLERITNPETCPDASQYKGDGNGWATNQPRWLLTRLLRVEGIDPFVNEE